MIGKLEPVALRELWKHEEHGFTVWLESNIELLAERIGIPLQVVEREKRIGSFKVDLVAESGDGSVVIIENQLEQTDHDHLGKLITYLVNLEAKIAIWIVQDARAEHLRVVDWLNESTPADVLFYLVKLEAYRIGSSDPAPLFSPLVGPSPESKAIGQEKKELADRHRLRLKFWEQLLARAQTAEVRHHANRSPTTASWLDAGSGRSGMTWVYNVWIDSRTAVELYIDAGSQETNKAIFDDLHANRQAIEAAFGAPLEWQRLDDKRAARLRATFNRGGLSAGEERWPEIQDEMINGMDRLVKALSPKLAALRS